MDVCKHFLARLIQVSLKSVYIIVLKEDITPTLLNYVKLLNNLKYEEGTYHSYIGDIKKLLDSFLFYWKNTMNEALKEADIFSNIIDKDTLLSLIDNTINVRHNRCMMVDKLFLPIETPEQQKPRNDTQIYDDIQEKHKWHVQCLQEMRAKVLLFDKKVKLEAFAREEFPKSLTKKNEVFLLAHTYISMVLADHLVEIKGSMQEILLRVRKNLRELQAESEQGLNSLLHQLYDKHKELLLLSRREARPSTEAAEINCCIDKIRQRVVDHQNDEPIQRLLEEERYFVTRMSEFQMIANNLIKLKTELDDVTREEEIYNSMATTELPGSRYECWQNMGTNYAERKDFLKQKMILQAKALLTFFTVRGPVGMVYTDNIGVYHIDVYGHQVYHFESDLKLCHLDCERNYIEPKPKELHFYDASGRYVIRDGEKIHQAMECTSSYKLGEDTLLKKITVDCGHSEKKNEECGMRVRDLTDVEILPKTEPVDITRTLNTEVVTYLWDALGAILATALSDVGERRPKNPIHFLAHRLLAHKYGKTKAEFSCMKQEAEKYRENIFKKRKDQAVAESRAWRARQVQRRKPEESDDSQERAQYNMYLATNEFINSLGTYYS